MADERPRARPLQAARPMRRPGPRQHPDEAAPEAVREGPQPERQIAFRTGLSAESRAAAFLIVKGFRIRDIRFDAVLVAPGRIPRHITAAFDTSG